MMNRVKFFRVDELPDKGVVGGIYFLHKENNPAIYICVEESLFESYTIENYVESDIQQISDGINVENDSINVVSENLGSVSYDTLRLKSAFAEVNNETLIFK